MKTHILKPRLYLNKFIRFLSISPLILSFSVNAQCVGGTAVSGGTAANDNSIGSLGFDVPSKALNSDANWASASTLITLSSGSSNYLKVTGFGFNLPSYAIICGVEVYIEKRALGLGLGASIIDNRVNLVKAGTIITGTNYAKAGGWSGSTTSTYGGPTDTWGGSLSVADVNNSGFGVAFSASITLGISVFPAAEINNIQIKLYYNLVLPTHLISFNSSLKNSVAQLNWKTAGEEVGEFITLQRSKDGSLQWDDIARFEMATAGDGKEYSYNDPLQTKGNYSYRLRITTNSSSETYSTIKNINYTGSTFVTAYPNPASNYITIENPDGITAMIVSNVNQQHFDLPYEITAKNTARLDISRLPIGIYFASMGSKQVKFIKN